MRALRAMRWAGNGPWQSYRWVEVGKVGSNGGLHKKQFACLDRLVPETACSGNQGPEIDVDAVRCVVFEVADGVTDSAVEQPQGNLEDRRLAVWTEHGLVE